MIAPLAAPRGSSALAARGRLAGLVALCLDPAPHPGHPPHACPTPAELQHGGRGGDGGVPRQQVDENSSGVLCPAACVPRTTPAACLPLCSVPNTVPGTALQLSAGLGTPSSAWPPCCLVAPVQSLPGLCLAADPCPCSPG